MYEYMENGSLQDHLHCKMSFFVVILLMMHLHSFVELRAKKHFALSSAK